MFRAFFIIFFGNEDYYIEFCIRVICELVKNEKCYLNNNFLYSLTGVKNVVESLLFSFVFVNVKDFCVFYWREVLRIFKLFIFVNMWYMFSLVNVFGSIV